MFKHILVPIDLRSEASWKRALPLAADQARHYGARLTVLYVVPDVWAMAPEPHEDDDRVKKLRAIAEEVPENGPQVEIRVRHHNSPHRCIREVASDEGVDLIVMNSHAPELRDIRLGSTATQVVHHAPCSIFVVR